MYLDEATYYSKVYGCWMGKNVGGTLGAPLEDIWGKGELFDISWYPEIAEGGIPNDDLEIQLVWLQMLEDRGLSVTARDFADYWLDCVQYNPDEYGLHKANLRRGLLPPLSGWYNNWFKDCMGSPIRSEIWACIAPGQPNIAASYAYQDAILDHAGGESVYGEIFNAALESAAFVESDPQKLLSIGLSFIPSGCLTGKAVRAAIEAHRQGLTWADAREAVREKAPSDIAQYSPVNLGFQTIGWLYGKDFGDALCKAVNCGYDTDCTGATLGAILGILGGREGLPEKWTAPLSDRIATNVENGGITNLRVPKDLDELTRKTIAIGKKVLALHEAAGPDLAPTDDTRALWSMSPTAVPWDLRAVHVSVDLPNGPAIAPGGAVDVMATVRNDRLFPQSVGVSLEAPAGFSAPADEGPMVLDPGEDAGWWFRIRCEDPALLKMSNRFDLRVRLDGQPELPSVPVVLLAASRWLVSDRFDGDLDTPTHLESDLNPEGPGRGVGEGMREGMREGMARGAGEGWTAVAFPDDAVDIEKRFGGAPGVLYLRHYVHSPGKRTVRAGFPSNVPFRMWLNGTPVHEARGPFRLRPNLGGEGRSYADIELPTGWSHFLIKVERRDCPVQAHFTLATGAPWFHGLTDLTRCRFPWEPANG